MIFKGAQVVRNLLGNAKNRLSTKTGTKTSLANGSLKAERNTLECSYLGILQFLDIHPLQAHK